MKGPFYLDSMISGSIPDSREKQYPAEIPPIHSRTKAGKFSTMLSNHKLPSIPGYYIYRAARRLEIGRKGLRPSVLKRGVCSLHTRFSSNSSMRRDEIDRVLQHRRGFTSPGCISSNHRSPKADMRKPVSGEQMTQRVQIPLGLYGFASFQGQKLARGESEQ